MKALRIFPSHCRLERAFAQQATEIKRLQTERDSAFASCIRHRGQPPAPLAPFVLNSNFAQEPAPYDRLMQEICGNTGNTYITYAFLKTLGLAPRLRAAQQVSNMWTDPLPDPDQISAEHTHCFITLQDQFQAALPDYIPVGKIPQLTTFIRALRIPVVAYSVGTNFLPDDTRRLVCPELRPLLHALADKCASIGVRGEITREALATLDISNTKVIGCPTYFENGPGRILHKRLLITTSGILGTGLFSTRAPNPVHFIAQSESLAMKLCLGGMPGPEDIAQFQAATAAYPGYGNAFLTALRHGRVQAFPDIDAWKRYIIQADICLAIGTRLHGSILAMSCGVPAICTAGDSRAAETCAYLGIPLKPGACGHDLDPGEQLAALDTDAINSRYRITYVEYLAWLSMNKL
jgi:hypothetical protein